MGNVRISKTDFSEFTQRLIPNLRTKRESFTSREAKFSFDDPIFRLKARGIGLKNKP